MGVSRWGHAGYLCAPISRLHKRQLHRASLNCHSWSCRRETTRQALRVGAGDTAAGGAGTSGFMIQTLRAKGEGHRRRRQEAGWR